MAKSKMDMMKPSVHLDHEALTQLGMHEGKLPKVGDKMHMSAVGHIRSVGETEQGRHMHVELHDMKAKPHAGKKPPGESDGDTEAMNKGMKRAVDKAVIGPKEGGSEDEGDAENS
jgi:hypothetical protein